MSPQARAARFFNKATSARPWAGAKGEGVGPPEKFLAISPAPTPATGLGYRIF